MMAMILPLSAWTVLRFYYSQDQEIVVSRLYEKIDQLTCQRDMNETRHNILNLYYSLTENEAKDLHEIILVNLFNYPEAEDIADVAFQLSRDKFGIPYNQMSISQREEIANHISKRYTSLLGENATQSQIWEANGYVAERLKREILKELSPLPMALLLEHLIASQPCDFK
jgi:hypothetical protein